jgi:hypothetical protein
VHTAKGNNNNNNNNNNNTCQETESIICKKKKMYCKLPVIAMKAHCEVEISVASFLTLALGGSE